MSPPNVNMFRSLTDPAVAVNLWEVAIVTALAVVLAIAISFARIGIGSMTLHANLISRAGLGSQAFGRSH